MNRAGDWIRAQQRWPRFHRKRATVRRRAIRAALRPRRAAASPYWSDSRLLGTGSEQFGCHQCLLHQCLLIWTLETLECSLSPFNLAGHVPGVMLAINRNLLEGERPCEPKHMISYHPATLLRAPDPRTFRIQTLIENGWCHVFGRGWERRNVFIVPCPEKIQIHEQNATPIVNSERLTLLSEPPHPRAVESCPKTLQS
jgi:hypothetical protein